MLLVGAVFLGTVIVLCMFGSAGVGFLFVVVAGLVVFGSSGTTVFFSIVAGLGGFGSGSASRFSGFSKANGFLGATGLTAGLRFSEAFGVFLGTLLGFNPGARLAGLAVMGRLCAGFFGTILTGCSGCSLACLAFSISNRLWVMVACRWCRCCSRSVCFCVLVSFRVDEKSAAFRTNSRCP